MEKINLKINAEDFSAYYFKADSEKGDKAIILLTEIWGVNENLLDVAERLRGEGYTILLPDLLIETGIPSKLTLQLFKDLRNPETRKEAEKEAKELFAPIRNPEFEKKTIEKLQVCFEYLDSKEEIDNIGVMGFSFGGHYSYVFAINQQKIKACVSFYGRNPTELEDVEKINCPVLAFHGEYDEPALENFPEFVERMKELKKNFTYFTYPKTKHSFFNDTNPRVYSKESSEDAWEKTIKFFGKNLS